MGMTSDIKSAYKSAKKEYTSMLPALSARYNDLYKQLDAEKKLSKEQDVLQSATEQTQLKSNLSKRGLEVNSSNPYYTGESSKLSGNQNLRARETSLAFEGQRANTALSQTQSEVGIHSAIADLTVAKSRDLTAAKQWQKTFEYTKSIDEANRALDIYKASKSSIGGGSSKYSNALASISADVYSGNSNSNREAIIAQLVPVAEQSGVSISKLQSDVYTKLFPEGFESRIAKSKSSNANEVQKVMDALGVDSATATKMIQNELGL